MNSTSEGPIGRGNNGNGLFAHIATSMNDMIFVIGPDGDRQYVSPSVHKVLGYAPAELIGRKNYDYLHPEDLPRMLEYITRAREGSPAGASRIEYRHRRKDGSYGWLEDEISRLPGSGGNTARFLVISRDITTRKQTAQESPDGLTAQRKSQRRWRAFIRALADGSMILDEDGRCLDLFVREESLLPKPYAKVKGRMLHQVLAAQDADYLLHIIRQTVETGQPQQFALELQIRGSKRWGEARISPMGLLEGGKRMAALIFTAVTERQWSAAQEERLLALRRRSEFIEGIIAGKEPDAKDMIAARAFGLDLSAPLFCCLMLIEPARADH